MKVLYKDELERLAVMEVSKASYDENEEVLELCTGGRYRCACFGKGGGGDRP